MICLPPSAASIAQWSARSVTALWAMLWFAALPSGAGPAAEAAAVNTTAPASTTAVALMRIDGAIGPATADYFARGLKDAQAQGAALVVLQLDTPGGLDTSMRQIIREILGSPIPVAAFVAPSGARAASAGTYMLYASHIAAMAPATNLGAATPVAIGIGGPQSEPLPGAKEPPRDKAVGAKAGKNEKDQKAAKDARSSRDDAGDGAGKGGGDALTQKRIHDASAYIRSLAQMRGRNADWAERAVREAVSLSANEALELKVIDVVASDVPDLLRKVDGRTVAMAAGERTLSTKDATTFAIEPDWRTRFLTVITDPSIAFILMLVGVYGLIFEFANPGYGLPGVAGGISLLLALFAFQLLPINYAGLALILLGIAMMVAEAFLPSFVLGTGGVIALAFGALMLIDTEIPGYGVPLGLVMPVAIGTGLIIFGVVSFALKARKRPIVSGREALVGATGEIMDAFSSEGWAMIEGEQWRVVSATPLGRGQKVSVVRIDGLTLTVVPEGGTT
ncbi:MAG: nodulation protein NfeD [Casimicrobiaceae bacterium]